MNRRTGFGSRYLCYSWLSRSIYLVFASSEDNKDAEDRQNDATRGRILCAGSYVNVYIVSVLCANLSLYISLFT